MIELVVVIAGFGVAIALWPSPAGRPLPPPRALVRTEVVGDTRNHPTSLGRHRRARGEGPEDRANTGSATGPTRGGLRTRGGRGRRGQGRRGQGGGTGPTRDDSSHLLAAELLAVALSAGCSLHTALVVAGERRPPGDPLHSAAVALRRGHPLAVVLEGLADRGGGWQVLATTLAVGAASGAPSVAAVRDVAASQRRQLRRAVERRVRRLPVLLLLPLVGLVLPAFVLVTFVPVALAIGNDWAS